MRRLSVLMILSVACLCALVQNPPAKETQAEIKGIPPRATPSDYQFQVRVGSTTLAGEFKGHSIPNAESTLTSDDYVAVEIALFGAEGAKLKLSANDFSLRINGKKAGLPSQPYGLVVGSVKDPEMEPPSKSKSKTSVGGGSGEQGESSTPPPIPISVRRGWAQRVAQASLPEGERSLPQAGLVFFQYRGKSSGIRSVELVYSGPAGNTTLALQP